MSVNQWLFFIAIVQIIHFFGTWKLYVAAGRKAWEAAVPVYNAIVLLKIIQRPTWWTILLFIPIINLIVFPVIWVETARTFGKKKDIDTFLSIVSCGFYGAYINYTQKLVHEENRDLSIKNKAADTVSSLLFAIVVATLVHTYVVQPYTIPTSSLEKSLLIGDFLFVSKANYGARVPLTTVALPMVHDSIPRLKRKSYSNFPQLPYFRLPGVQKIKRADIVVFSWPVDTVHYFFEPKGKPGVIKPIDKKSNYVKRCVAIAGDKLEIKNGIIYINDAVLQLPERAKPQFVYNVYAKKGISSELVQKSGSTEFARTYEVAFENQEQVKAIEKFVRASTEISKGLYKIKTNETGIPAEIYPFFNGNLKEVYDYEMQINLTEAGAEVLKNSKSIDSVRRIIFPKEPNTAIFPHNTNWSLDNYGPITIPAAGTKVALNTKNIALYERLINTYENKDNSKIEIKGNEIFLDGKVIKNYTFKQNYYWMMGDNRHKSEDSRYWGFVPEDHVVGKPVFIWMSIDGINGPFKNWKIRWERLFTTVNGDGQPQSYFRYFLLALALYFAGEYFWKKRKKTAIDK